MISLVRVDLFFLRNANAPARLNTADAAMQPNNVWPKASLAARRRAQAINTAILVTAKEKK